MRFSKRKKAFLRPISMDRAANYSAWNIKPVVPLFSASIAMSLLISGCGLEFKSSHRSKSQTNTHDGNLKIEEHRLNQEFITLTGAEMFRYKATVHWAPNIPNVSVFINKQFAFKAESTNQTSYSFGLDHNKQYIISVVSDQGGDQPKLIKEEEISTPLDIKLDKAAFTEELKKDGPISITANRVFINKMEGNEPSFLSEGKHITINTEELISDEGTIATFNENKKAGLDNLGRDGGKIIIKSKYAIGSLSIILRGENGGDGKNGEPYTDRAPTGSSGVAGDYTFNCTGQYPRNCICDRKTANRENGGRGAKGSPGRTGSNGRRGGNSGSVSIEIAHKSNQFFVNINSFYGVAGIPGKSGPPQLGGLPGQAWKPPFNHGYNLFCNRKDGDIGEGGDPGKDGISESNGNIEVNCVSIGEGFGRCS